MREAKSVGGAVSGRRVVAHSPLLRGPFSHSLVYRDLGGLGSIYAGQIPYLGAGCYIDGHLFAWSAGPFRVCVAIRIFFHSLLRCSPTSQVGRTSSPSSSRAALREAFRAYLADERPKGRSSGCMAGEGRSALRWQNPSRNLAGASVSASCASRITRVRRVRARATSHLGKVRSGARTLPRWRRRWRSEANAHLLPHHLQKMYLPVTDSHLDVHLL